ncbi:MAG TPA: methylenetetrahydrofolate--tRNA-(uracil(54)-C(5))-methyltransferase (FADH(2)-oxidizing) TrmFO [Fibrobacteria bacterium]|nr:methylenetetrahydrofolate--tRNA-(uracil(54)-C(5))-methyltransferase (FADH(2)-oxidizing) TrmFO [Fibrobacteria bacterium]
MSPLHVIGAGLAGSEAALQLADAGHEVVLHEMRPEVATPAHKTDAPAELVCSNSLKGLALTSAHGLLKEEIGRLGSKLLPLAFASRVPAGESLAVDRDVFSAKVREALESRPNIRFVRGEVTALDPDAWTILATGPLTSEALAKDLFSRVSAIGGGERLYFFDSIAPVVFADSLEEEFLYSKNRWDKGDAPDFLNVPLDKEQYEAFVEALVAADTVEAKPFEKGQLFEGCLPIEEMARRGRDTLRFGPMRPVGLMDPRTGKVPRAVIQLRAENAQKSLYNLVGFQTRLKWGTQKEILTKIPGLRMAEFARLGAMHRNTFLDAPRVLTRGLRLKGTKIFCAGQITGAEGYTEALSTGFYAASCLHAALAGNEAFNWPEGTCVRALTDHLTHPNPEFQPMNFNFGLLPSDPTWHKKKRKELQIEACQKAWEGFNPL